MPGKSPAVAVENFLAPIRRAVSCVTPDQMAVSPGGRAQMGKVHALTFQNHPDGVPLKTSDGGVVLLDLRMQYEIVTTDDEARGPYKVSTRKYSYSVGKLAKGDALSYHWHPSPERERHTDVPHMHLGSAQLTLESLLSKRHHLPTGRISIEEVLRYCIAELGVLAKRADWRSVLADSEDLFKMWRTWPTSPSAPAAPIPQ